MLLPVVPADDGVEHLDDKRLSAALDSRVWDGRLTSRPGDQIEVAADDAGDFDRHLAVLYRGVDERSGDQRSVTSASRATAAAAAGRISHSSPLLPTRKPSP